jgi:hypothetical protein
MKTNFRLSKPRFSSYYGYEVVDILKRKKLLGFINYWSWHETIKNVGQAEEVVFLLNNPNELQKRLKNYFLK